MQGDQAVKGRLFSVLALSLGMLLVVGCSAGIDVSVPTSQEQQRREDLTVLSDLHLASAASLALMVDKPGIVPDAAALNSLVGLEETPFTESDVATEGAISVREIDSETVILVRKSLSGNVYCTVVSTRREQTFGMTDAHSVDECADESWALEDSLPVRDDDVMADLAVTAGMVGYAQDKYRGKPITAQMLAKLTGEAHFNEDLVASVGEVSVRDAREGSVLLVEKGSSGATFCWVVGKGENATGNVDAQTQEECSSNPIPPQ